jgi:SM-20-related protein
MITTTLEYIDTDTLDKTEVKQAPYPHAVIKNMIHKDKLDAVCNAFPELTDGGSFNCNDENTQGALAEFINELHSDEMRTWLENNFDIDLEGKPIMSTLRGLSRAKDGRIHTDSKDKVITLLIYLTQDWDNDDGGNLRVLRSDNIDDYADEVRPEAGTCLIFKVTDDCWHGYKPFVGTRRQIMFNFLVSDAALKKHKSSHGLSAFMKKLKSKL